MKKIILLFVLLVQFAIGQVKDYKFSLINGNYTSLSSSTVWQSGTQINTDTSIDVALSNPFTVGSDTYNSIRIYNNGFVTLGKGLNNGQTMDAIVKYPISNTVKGWAVDYVISGFGGNLMASNVGSPSISYGSVGTDFVIQYQELSIVGFTQTRVSFQIVLKANGAIQIVYGNNLVGQANVVSPQVGLRGKAVLVDSGDAIGTKVYTYPDWQNRKLITGDWNIIEADPNYPNNSKGTVITSSMSWKNTALLPQSGLIFQFKP